MRWSGSLKRVRRDDRRAHVPYGMHVFDPSSMGAGRCRWAVGGAGSTGPLTPRPHRRQLTMHKGWFAVAIALRQAIGGVRRTGRGSRSRLAMSTRVDQEPWLVMHFLDVVVVVHWIESDPATALESPVQRVGSAEAILVRGGVFEIPTGCGPLSLCPPSVAIAGQLSRDRPELPSDIPFAHVRSSLDGCCGIVHLRRDLSCDRTVIVRR